MRCPFHQKNGAVKNEKRKNGRMEEWKNGRMEEWKNGRMEEWKNGRMEEWKNDVRVVCFNDCFFIVI